MANLITSPFLWMWITGFFMFLFLIIIILLIIIGKKTHGIIEFKSWIKGNPIALFFQENRYCHWKVIKPEAGIIQDKDYGAFTINERATYIDEKTKNVLIPFDTSFASSLNVHSAKLIEDLQYVFKTEEEMKDFKKRIDNDTIDENEPITVLKTTVHFGSVKSIMNAILPHNIHAKIVKTIAQRTQGYGGNVQSIIMYALAFLGAIGMGALVIKLIG